MERSRVDRLLYFIDRALSGDYDRNPNVFLGGRTVRIPELASGDRFLSLQIQASAKFLSRMDNPIWR